MESNCSLSYKVSTLLKPMLLKGKVNIQSILIQLQFQERMAKEEVFHPVIR